MKDSLRKLHPLLLICYFLCQAVLATVCFHPLFIGISLFMGLTYLWIVAGFKRFAVWLGITALYMIVFGAVNPFLNHQGNTVIGMAFGRNLTLESLCYGLLTGAMMGTVCLWLYIMSLTVDSKQASFVFGKGFPIITLMMFITMRLVRRYRVRAAEIFDSRKGFYGDKDTVKTGIKTCDVLLTYALENGVDTADSMCARGYGVKKHTQYYDYAFNVRDRVSSAVLIICLCVVMWGIFAGGCKMYFFPAFFTVDFPFIPVLTAYAVLCGFPVAIYVWSEIKWRSIR